jgi:hypothetical protein
LNEKEALHTLFDFRFMRRPHSSYLRRRSTKRLARHRADGAQHRSRLADLGWSGKSQWLWDQSMLPESSGWQNAGQWSRQSMPVGDHVRFP